MTRNYNNVAKSSYNRDTSSVCDDQTADKNRHLVQIGLEHSERHTISVVSVCVSEIRATSSNRGQGESC